MKLFHITTVAALIALLGCATSRMTINTTAPDGFYVESTDTLGTYPLQAVPPSGGRGLKFRIKHYGGFVPRQVVVFDAPEGCYVQVNGQPTGDHWSKDGFIIVANGKPYFELLMSGNTASETGERIELSATVSLVLRTRQEAEAVASALRQRYSLPEIR